MNAYGKKTETELTGEICQALPLARVEQKILALQVLQGKKTPELQPVGPLLMSMGHAAKYLGIGRSTLWRLVQNGRIKKHELFPGCFRLRRADLDAIVNPLPENPS